MRVCVIVINKQMKPTDVFEFFLESHAIVEVTIFAYERISNGKSKHKQFKLVKRIEYKNEILPIFNLNQNNKFDGLKKNSYNFKNK